MTSRITLLLPLLLAVAAAGCSSMPESQATVDARNGPAFTQEEKDAMTTEEKVALYNEEVREEDQIVCRRERTVGSRMNKTRCVSRAELKEEHENSQEAMRRAQYDTHINGSGN